MIIVIGCAIAREGTEQEVRALALKHVQRSRTEPGCISHEVSCDAENPRRFVFVERWSDIGALHMHFGVPASREFAQSIGRLCEGRPEMAIYEANPIPQS